VNATPVITIVVVVLVLLLVATLVVLAARRNRRRALLRERFGPEYDLAVSRGRDRRAVEQRLAELAERRDTLRIRDVGSDEGERFAQRWADVQHGFVDDPGQAVADADGLINGVLRSRGYPVENFDDRAALVATDHQDVIEGYRAAHDTYAEHLQTGSAEIERLRQAFLNYREVFDRLNRPAGAAKTPAAASRSAAIEPERAGETPPPAGETPPPAGETPPPAGETRTPAGETPVPAAETAPAGETTAPAAETAPAGETPAPAAETAPAAGKTESPPAAAEAAPPAAVRLDPEEAADQAPRQQGR
jgi:hypothetical protein